MGTAARFLTTTGMALVLCVAATAQSQLCTVPILPGNSNNACVAGGGVFFDVTVTNPIRITALDCNFKYPAIVGLPVGLTVHICPTTYVGNELNPAAWTQVAVDDGTSTQAGIDYPTPIKLLAPFSLQPGTYGMALVGNAATGHAYTGIGTTAVYMNFSNADLALNLGASSNTPFSGTSTFAPRVWNGCIHYGPDCYVKYGSGCPGSGAFVPDLGMTSCAIAGQPVTLSVSQALGGTLAVLLFGTGRGPLSMGAGCDLNFSVLYPISIALPLGGAGPGAGSLSLSGVVPAGTLGFTLNLQVFTQDPGGAIGFANSKGLEFTIQ